MAETAAASIELTAVDRASAVLAAVKGRVDEVTKSAESIRAAWGSGLMESFTRGPALAAVGVLGALSTAAIGLGTYFISLGKDAMTAQAGLKSLSEITGATIEGLSAIRAVAKISGVEMEAIGGAMTKLAKSTVVGGKEISTAFNSIGLSLEDMRGKSTDQQFLAIANALEKYQDGAEKTALAQILMGKSGAQMLPIMRDLAESGDLVGKVTKQQAEQADELEKNIKRLTAAKEAWKKVVGAELVPVLDDVVKVLLKVQTETNGTLSTAKSLAADGTIRSWAEGAVIGVAYLIDILQFLWRTLKTVGVGIAGFATASMSVLGGLGDAAIAIIKGNYSELPGIVKRGADAVVNVAKMAGQDIAEVWEPKFLATRFKEQFAASAAAVGTSTETIKEKIKGLGAPAEQAKEKVNALEKSLSELMNKLNNPDVDTEFVKGMSLLTKALQVGAIGIAVYADAVAKLTAGSKTVVEMNKAIADSLKVNEDIIDKNRQAIEDAARAMVDGNKELTQEIAALGLSKVARELYMLAIKKEIDLRRINATATGEERDMRLAELDSLYAVREELIKHKDQVEQNDSVWKSFSSTTTDFLTDLIQNGRSAFGDLYNQAKKFGAQMLAIFAQKYILGMEVQGGGGMAGTVLNQLLGSAGGAGGGMLSGLANSLGLSGLSSSLSSIAAPLAAVAAASYALGKAISGGYSIGKVGTGGNLGLLTGGVVGGLLARAFGRKLVDSGIQADVGTKGITNAKTYSFEKGGLFRSDKTTLNPVDAATASALEQARAKISDTLRGVAEALGVSTADFDKFTYNLKVSLKGLSDTDAQAAITKAFDEMARGAAKTLDFAGVSKDLQAYVQAFSGTADELLEFLSSYVVMVKTIEAAQAYARDSLANSAADVKDLLDQQANNVAASYRAQLKATDALLAMSPDTADALGAVVTGMQSLRSASAQLQLQIAQVRDALGAMFGDTIRSMRLSVLSVEDQYKFLQVESDQLLAKAMASNDALEIQRLANQINADINQAYGLLTADQKAALAPDQIARIDAINKLLDERLGTLGTSAQTDANARMDALSKKLDEIATAMLTSATKNNDAADKQLEAAKTPKEVDVNITVTDDRLRVQASEVGG